MDEKCKKILDDSRILLHAKTVKELAEKGAKVVIMAHQGRPGGNDFSTLEEHSKKLGEVLRLPVMYVNDVYGEKAKRAIASLNPGDILVLGNVRTVPGEMEEKTPLEHSRSEMVGTLAPLFDLYVNDAFSVAHRSQASVVGFAHVLPSAVGRLMEEELDSLHKVTEEERKERPCMYVLGGAKVEEAVGITNYALSNRIADRILTGGLVAGLFLHAQGVDLGEENLKNLEKRKELRFVPDAQGILHRFPDKVVLPQDLAVNEGGKRVELAIRKLPAKGPIEDIGSKTAQEYVEIVSQAKMIIFHGPLGVYENPEFAKSSRAVFKAISQSGAFTVAGGGDTMAALHQFGLTKRISYLSTGGGALLDFLMGKTLPGVEVLRIKSRSD